MYHVRKLPEPFRDRAEKISSTPLETFVSVPIEAKEKTVVLSGKKNPPVFPMTALLFLHLFSNKKGDE